MNNSILILILCTGNWLFAQNYQTFNLTPDIDAYKQNSQFHYLIVDTLYIYVIGDKLKERFQGGEVFVENYFTKFDYTGKLIALGVLKDTNLNNPRLDTNTPCFKKNDSLYFCYLYTVNDTTKQYSDPTLFELNLANGKVEKVKIFVHPINNHLGLFCRAFNYNPNTGLLTLGFLVDSKNDPLIYIYELDSNLVISRTIALPEFNKFHSPHWIEKQSDGTYDIVCNSAIIRNNGLTVISELTFIKCDSLGKILIRKELITPANIIFSGESYSIHRNKDQSFNISIHEYKSQIDRSAPLALHASSQFDTLFWMKRFYEYPEIIQENPQYLINYMAYSPFDTSFVTSGDINEQGTQNSYGLLFKVTKNGDSLWTRKYLPAGFGPDRALWMNFYQVAISPQNTIIVCGRVSDNLEQVVKGWLLQLDKDGCIVPGCGEIVKSEDIQSGKVKAFKLYPNPARDKFYLLSRISSSGKFKFTLYSLEARKIKETSMQVETGVQYIFMVPEDIPPASYILRISDEKGRLLQEEKLLIQK